MAQVEINPKTLTEQENRALDYGRAQYNRTHEDDPIEDNATYLAFRINQELIPNLLSDEAAHSASNEKIQERFGKATEAERAAILAVLPAKDVVEVVEEEVVIKQ